MKLLDHAAHELTGTPPRIMRPSTVATIAYAFLYAVLALWFLTTMRWSEFGDILLAPRLFGLSLFWILTAIHVLWFVVLLLDLRGAWRAEPGVRKAHLAGTVLSMVTIGAVQFGVLAMRTAALNNPG